MEVCMEINRNNSLTMVMSAEDMPIIAKGFQALEPLLENWSGIRLEVVDMKKSYIYQTSTE